MTTFHAQPYDMSASGFYFESAEEYSEKATALRNDHGDPVEEFEIQFIEGDAIDAALIQAMGIHQGDLTSTFDRLEAWDDDQKRNVVIAVGECGYQATWQDCDPDRFDIEIYTHRSLKDLAEEFVADGLYGDIPEPLRFYIDYEAIARDLAVDYSETDIAGDHFIYRCR